MSRRIVLGPRSDGTAGLFVSPPGVDAFTAPDSSLVLNVSTKVSQLLLMGRVFADFQVVALNVSRSPIVMLTSQYDFSAVTGHTLGPGPMRPSPPALSGAVGAQAAINGNGASMTITLMRTASGGPYPCIYQVYNKAFT
jgi:hypothetical protein